MRARAICIILIALMFLTGCSSGRRIIPPGEVPELAPVSSEDEQYGHEVLGELTQQFPLENDDAAINRVRDIVDKLTAAAGADREPWHVYVLKGPKFKNAAATRGNFVFVWTGMLATVKSDAELATVLSHEIGHVLAGHTTPSPAEEANKILAGLGGTIAGQAVSYTKYGALADLAEILIRTSLEAMVVNPNQKRLEAEADQIGIFVMADAGYDPDDALEFWRHVSTDPDFRSAPLQFLSTHPSSEDRIASLEQILPEARARYQNRGGPKPGSLGRKDRKNNSPARPGTGRGDPVRTYAPPIGKGGWIAAEGQVPVFEQPDSGSPRLGTLKRGEVVEGERALGRWLKLTSPLSGYARSASFSPR